MSVHLLLFALTLCFLSEQAKNRQANTATPSMQWKADKASKQESALTKKEKLGISVTPSHPDRNFLFAILQSRLVILPLLLVGSIYIAFALSCMAWWIIFGGIEDVSKPFKAQVDFPLFCGAAALFVWKMTAAAQHTASAPSNKLVFTWHAGWPIQWAFCVLWMNRLKPVYIATLEPSFEQSRCHALPQMCHLHRASTGGVLAQACFWAVAVVLTSGYIMLYGLIAVTSIVTGVGCIYYTYIKCIRRHLFRLVLEPANRLLWQPLVVQVFTPPLRYILRPFADAVIDLLDGPISGFIVKSQFSSPQAKATHVYLEPKLPFLILASLVIGAFIAFASAIILIAKQQDWNIETRNGPKPMANLIFYNSVLSWLLWRDVDVEFRTGRMLEGQQLTD